MIRKSFSTILFCILFAASGLNAKTITVCASCNIKSIKKAIELSSSGDTILVKSGTYAEGNIVITKTLFIK